MVYFCRDAAWLAEASYFCFFFSVPICLFASLHVIYDYMPSLCSNDSAPLFSFGFTFNHSSPFCPALLLFTFSYFSQLWIFNWIFMSLFFIAFQGFLGLVYEWILFLQEVKASLPLLSLQVSIPQKQKFGLLMAKYGVKTKYTIWVRICTGSSHSSWQVRNFLWKITSGGHCTSSSFCPTILKIMILYLGFEKKYIVNRRKSFSKEKSNQLTPA